MTIELVLDTIEVERLIEQLGATTGQVYVAQMRALKKMRRKVETEVKRRVSAETRLPQRAIKGRFFATRYGQIRDEIRFWVGVADVDPAHVYEPVQRKRGSCAGRFCYSGAFVQRMYGTNRHIWIRRFSRHFDKRSYSGWRYLKRRADTDRFPVVKASVSIHESVETAFDDYARFDLSVDFEKFLLHEIEYEVSLRQ